MAEFLIKFKAISELAGKTHQFTTNVFCDNKLANEFTIRKRIRKSFSLQMNRLLVSVNASAQCLSKRTSKKAFITCFFSIRSQINTSVFFSTGRMPLALDETYKNGENLF